MSSPFDLALAGRRCHMERVDGACSALPVRRWHADCDATDAHMVQRCHGATLDVGCGPGRLTLAVLARGAVAVGIDTSPAAVRMTRRRGGVAELRSIFEGVPSEGQWRHVLLADGNVGIGGDPRLLLRRVREVLAPGGTVIVEAAAPRSGLWCGPVRIGAGPWFPWAEIGLDALLAIARGEDLRPVWTVEHSGRWFVELAGSGER